MIYTLYLMLFMLLLVCVSIVNTSKTNKLMRDTSTTHPSDGVSHSVIRASEPYVYKPTEKLVHKDEFGNVYIGKSLDYKKLLKIKGNK